MCRRAVRERLRRGSLRDPRQRQREFPAGARRRGQPRDPHLRGRQPGAGVRALHPGRRDGTGDHGRRPGAVLRRGDFLRRAGTAGTSRLAGHSRQLPLLDVAAQRRTHLRHPGARPRLPRHRPAGATPRACRCAVAATCAPPRFPMRRQPRKAPTRCGPPSSPARISSCTPPAGWSPGSPCRTRNSSWTWTSSAPSTPSPAASTLDDNAFAMQAFREIGPGPALPRRRSTRSPTTRARTTTSSWRTTTPTSSGVRTAPRISCSGPPDAGVRNWPLTRPRRWMPRARRRCANSSRAARPPCRTNSPERSQGALDSLVALGSLV